MDPLTITTSIIAVTGALSTVSQKLIEYAKNLAHAQKEVKFVAQEMSLFSNLLRSLPDTMQRVVAVELQVLDLSKICEDLVAQAKENVGDFNKFLDNLKPLRDPIDASLIAKTMARLRWAFQKTELVLLRSKLDSSKLTLSLCVTTIHIRITIEQLEAAEKKAERDQTEITELQNQVQLLQTQLADESSMVRETISESRKLEYHVRGPGQRSVNRRVARHALNLAKTQQEYEIRPTPMNLSRQPSAATYTTSDESSSRPGPSRPRGPRPSSPFQGTSALFHQPPVPTRHARRRKPTVAAAMTPSGRWIFDESGASINTRVDPSSQGLHPAATNLDTDMGYRALGQRQERGSRVGDADRKVVWTEKHHGDDEGH